MTDFILGLLPIILFFSLIVIFKKSTLISSFTSLLAAIILNFINPGWQMSLTGTVLSITEGFLVALWPIGCIVIAALFCYSLSLETGQINIIKKTLEGISGDRRMQVLLIAWGFGSFMEGVAGYGTSVAIPAGILLVLGFGPLYSALICLISIGGSNSFGSVGIPVIMLANQVKLDYRVMGVNVAIQLLPFVVIIPVILVILAGRRDSKKIRNAFDKKIICVLAACTVAYIPAILTAVFIGPEMPAIIGGVLIMAAVIIMSKILYKNEENKEKIKFKTALKAFLPYIFMVIFILMVNPANKVFYEFLNKYTTISVNFSAGNNYKVGNGETTYFRIFLSPVIPILLATLAGGLLQGTRVKIIGRTFVWVIRNNIRTLFTIMGIVSLASFMKHSGIIISVADGFTMITGRFYPLIAPFIGAIGTFMTGSNTSANLLFGSLQSVAADNLGINKYWLVASNTVGATLGTMISLQSLSIVAATVGLKGKESIVLKKAVRYSLSLLTVLAVYVYIMSLIIKR